MKIFYLGMDWFNFESFLPYYVRVDKMSQFDSVTQSLKANFWKLNINDGKYS